MNCINTVADQTEASNGGVQLARDRRLEMRRIRMAAGCSRNTCYSEHLPYA